VRRDVVGRLEEDNALKSKTTRDHCLCLQPSKRLETRPLCAEGSLE